MKKIILSLVLLLTTFLTFSQQLPIEIINNSSQDLDIFLFAYGDNPFNQGECDDCTTPIETESFVLDSTDSINLNSFGDVPAGVRWFGYSCDDIPPFLGGPGCDGTQADALCGNPPYWTFIGFSYPGGCCERIGDTNCGVNASFSQGSFTATWTVVGGTDIVVVFDD